MIEGAATYGAILAATLAARGHSLAEAARMDTGNRHGVGKSDTLDAHRIAAAVLGLKEYQLRRPRLHQGVRASLQVLVSARESMSAERTRAINALTALLRIHELGIDARTSLSASQIKNVSRWRTREEPLATATARSEARRLAERIITLNTDLTTNHARVRALVEISEAAPLLEETGIGPITAAICLTAWSHHGRIRSEAAYASLAGVNPIPASSGNTIRHRLNRGGDRRLNHALHTAALVRMTHDRQTRAYVHKRTTEGRTTREIRRCIKRYLARRIYRTLNSTTPTTTPT